MVPATPAPIASVARVAIPKGEDPTLVGLWASEAPAEEVTAALEQELGCQIELVGKVPAHPLTLNLSPRAPERLFPALARRMNCRILLLYKLGRLPVGSPYEKGEGMFAEGPTPTPLPRSLEVGQLLALLRSAGVQVETDPVTPPRGKVRLPQAQLPLRVTLTYLSRTTGMAWWPVVRLTPRKSVDAAAEGEDRRQAYYTDLGALTSQERREELTADLDELDRVPLEEHDAALGQFIGDVAGLGTLFDRTPEEHRAGIRARLRLIGADYTEVLDSLHKDRRAELQKLVDAVRDLRERLREPR